MGNGSDVTDNGFVIPVNYPPIPLPANAQALLGYNDLPDDGTYVDVVLGPAGRLIQVLRITFNHPEIGHTIPNWTLYARVVVNGVTVDSWSLVSTDPGGANPNSSQFFEAVSSPMGVLLGKTYGDGVHAVHFQCAMASFPAPLGGGSECWGVGVVLNA
jgi:hypothetical protein